MKALVVRLSSIGDVVHTLPTLAALGNQHGMEVGLDRRAAVRVLLEGNPAPRSWSWRPRGRRPSEWSEARSGGPGAPHASASTSPSTSRVCGSRRPGPGSRGRASGRRLRAPLAPGAGLGAVGRRAEPSFPRAAQHVIDKNLSLLGPLGIEATGLREFPLPYSAEVAARVEGRLEGPDGGGGLRRSSTPPGAGPASCGRRSGSESWPGGCARAASARSSPGDPARKRTWRTGSWPRRPTAPRCARSRRACSPSWSWRGEPGSWWPPTPDPSTSPARSRTPVVALFGPTDPARNGPFDPDRRSWSGSTPVLRSLLQSRRVQRHVGIMAEIPVAEVLAAAERRLASAPEQSHPMPSRYRVPVGWLLGVVVVVLARPTPLSVAIGVPLVIAGEALRIWASGHIREDEGPRHRRPLRALSSPPVRGQPASLPSARRWPPSSLWVVLAVAVYFLAFFPVGDARGDRLPREEVPGGARGVVCRGPALLAAHPAPPAGARPVQRSTRTMRSSKTACSSASSWKSAGSSSIRNASGRTSRFLYA